MTRIIRTFEEIAGDYRALFFDVWGCLHDGIKPYPDAVRVLKTFISNGGKVVLLTNSPRPSPMTARQIDMIGVSRDAWHIIVTSGDAARASFFSGEVGIRILHIGKSEELSFFDPAASGFDCSMMVTRVPVEEAKGIVCTGPYRDELFSIRPYDRLLQKARSMDLPMLCANPDLHVDRGAVREICAGLIAMRYREIGGRVLIFGKPQSSIYELARKRLMEIAPDIDASDILCVGDGIMTDIRGALDYGLKSLFVSGGLAAAETGTTDMPDPDLLEKYIRKHKTVPDFTIGKFR